MDGVDLLFHHLRHFSHHRLHLARPLGIPEVEHDQDMVQVLDCDLYVFRVESYQPVDLAESVV